MKALRLFLLAFLVMSTWTHAAQPQALSPVQQQNVERYTREMRAQGIPAEPVQVMFSLMYQNRYQEQNIVRAGKTILGAADKGLPTEPVINKAMEGMAKQVSEEQVIAAMETVRNRYSNAYRLAGSLSDDRKNTAIMAEAIAGSLAAGMADKEMDKIMDRLRERTQKQTSVQADKLSLQTMLTVRSMMRLGANPADTSDTVRQALEQRYTAQQMEQLRNQFFDEAPKTSAKQLAQQYARSIGKGGNSSSGSSGSDGGGSGSGGSGGSGSGGSGSGGSGSDGGGSGSGGSGGSGSGSGGSGGSGSGSGGSGGSGSGSGGSGGSGSGSGGSGGSGSGSGK